MVRVDLQERANILLYFLDFCLQLVVVGTSVNHNIHLKVIALIFVIAVSSLNPIGSLLWEKLNLLYLLCRVCSLLFAIIEAVVVIVAGTKDIITIGIFLLLTI